MIEAVFFDNDGILVDTEGEYFTANRIIFEEAGFELDRDTYIDLSLRQGRSVFDLMLDAGESQTRIEDLRDRRNVIYRDQVARGVTVFDGAADVLAELHGRYPLAVVTSAHRWDFELAHRDSGLLHHFEFVLANGEYRRSKPHPDPYLEAAQRLDVAPERCVVIEDSVRGLQAAVAAGMRCLAIPHDLTLGGDFSRAAAVLSSIRDVPDAIASL